MFVQNLSESFSLTYGRNDVVVPHGVNEFSEALAYHIQYKAAKWGFDVRLIQSVDEMKRVIFEMEEEKRKKETPQEETVVAETVDDKPKTSPKPAKVKSQSK